MSLMMRQIFFLLWLIYNITAALANNAIHINLSNNLVRKAQIDVINENVANMLTSGYEARQLITGKHRLSQGKGFDVFTKVKSHSIDHSPLSVRVTGNPLDIVIQGGYLKVRTPKGNRYTLDGAMSRDYQGMLINHAGYQYLDVNSNPINIPIELNLADITVNAQGGITSPFGLLGTLGAFTFEQTAKMIRQGDGLYLVDGLELPAEKFVVTSKSIALSNVNGANSIRDILELQHSIKATNQMIKIVAKLERNNIRNIAKN